MRPGPSAAAVSFAILYCHPCCFRLVIDSLVASIGSFWADRTIYRFYDPRFGELGLNPPTPVPVVTMAKTLGNVVELYGEQFSTLLTVYFNAAPAETWCAGACLRAKPGQEKEDAVQLSHQNCFCPRCFFGGFLVFAVCRYRCEELLMCAPPRFDQVSPTGEAICRQPFVRTWRIIEVFCVPPFQYQHIGRCCPHNPFYPRRRSNCFWSGKTALYTARARRESSQPCCLIGVRFHPGGIF